MSSRFQSASLIASPFYPNSITWSEENLVAIASGHIITILNPASLDGPRSLIALPESKPFPIGVIDNQSLVTPLLMPILLSREFRPCARSIAWSHAGLASNSGCLLAVCTTDGHIRLYRSPFCEFSFEWVEVGDISKMLYDYFCSINFGEANTYPLQDDECISSEKLVGRKRKAPKRDIIYKGSMKEQWRYHGNDKVVRLDENGESPSGSIKVFTEMLTIPLSSLKLGSSVEVFEREGLHRTWKTGVVKQTDASRALVLFSKPFADGQQDAWVEFQLTMGSDKEMLVKDSNVDNVSSCFPNLRPSMSLGELPKEILELKKILKKGQLLDSWLDNRWVEGSFMGFNGSDLLVQISGSADFMKFDPTCVRLASVWKPDLLSWEVPVPKIEHIEAQSKSLSGVNICQRSSFNKSVHKQLKQSKEDSSPMLITSQKYLSHIAMLSSLVVAWSPRLQPPSDNPAFLNLSTGNCGILAIGGKSGNIAFLRIFEPHAYNIVHAGDTLDALFIEFLQAHNAWITAICWGAYSAGVSASSVLLATGSSDGSVKIWRADVTGLIKSSGNSSSFLLLKEIVGSDSASISTLALTVPGNSPSKILVAIGKTSGLLEVWTYYTCSNELKNSGVHYKHKQVVMGLSWAFDGSCLYSCSQDNSFYSWMVQGNVLQEVPFPASTPCSENFSDMSLAFEACFGLALSPGNLVVAVVHSLDVDLLNQMYEARIQKAAVEFFWTGGQQRDVLSDKHHYFDIESLPTISKRDLESWLMNILWSLKFHEHTCRPLVIWDIVAALLAFKQSSLEYVQWIVVKWLSNWLLGSHSGLSLDSIVISAPSLFLKTASRHLHLLDIICRRVMLSEFSVDELNAKQHNLNDINANGRHKEQSELWIRLLFYSEMELRQRLVAFILLAILNNASRPVGVPSIINWLPIGLTQMKAWVTLNHGLLHDQLKLLTSKVKQSEERLCSDGDEFEEKCSFCDASVPFESPEDAFCRSIDCSPSHRLARCAVSMQVCPTSPLWFCVCCRRWVSKLAPQTFFSIPKSPLEILSLISSADTQEHLKALCPFCGVLLQRVQSELSPTPV